MREKTLLLAEFLSLNNLFILYSSSKQKVKINNKKSKNIKQSQRKRSNTKKPTNKQKTFSSKINIPTAIHKNPTPPTPDIKKKKPWFQINLFSKTKSKKPKDSMESIKTLKDNNNIIIEPHKVTAKKIDVLTEEKYEKERKEVKQLIDLHLDTINRVDNLLKAVKKGNTNDDDKNGFFDKISLINPSEQRGSNKDKSPFPEFLSTTPFPRYVIDVPKIAQSSMPSNTNNADISENNDLLNTKMIDDGSQVLITPGEKPSKIELTGNDETNLISEITPPIKEPEQDEDKKNKKRAKIKWLFTGIDGFDELLEKGIPAGSNIIVAGGPGCGKTIFCLQTIYNKASEGEDCVFLSMEERPERLKHHMQEFGFKVKAIEESEDQIILKANGKGRIALKRLQPIRLARSIEALLEKASGTLPVDIDLVLDFIPKGFNACLLSLDSISAIETAFSGTKRQYRIYIEQLFRYFEHLDITTFMITESSEAPRRFSNTGVEEFLADGIFVFYNFQGVKKRTRGAEIYKLRGCSHSQRIVPVNITNKGLVISPEEVCREQSRA